MLHGTHRRVELEKIPSRENSIKATALAPLEHVYIFMIHNICVHVCVCVCTTANISRRKCILIACAFPAFYELCVLFAMRCVSHAIDAYALHRREIAISAYLSLLRINTISKL